MDTFSATPFCYATFVWQTPVIRWWTCISPETVECFLCACDLQGWTQASKLSSFPLLKDNLGDISCPHVLTLHGSPGHPQHSLQTMEPVQWVPWESPFDFWPRPGTPTWLTEEQPQSLACFMPLDYTCWFLALPL